MKDNLTIAVLGGTGKEGSGLALRWAHAGYKVIIGSRKEEKALNSAAELNEILGEEKLVGMQNSDAAKAADICVLTVVQAAHQPALEGLKEVLHGKILVDATARLKFPELTPPAAPAAAEIAQEILGPETRVVGAFQNVPAPSLKKNLGQPVQTDVMVCADDLEAAEQVIVLAEAAGMRAFYAGGLKNAIVVEGMTSLLIKMNKHYGGHGTVQIAGIDKA